MATVKGGYVNTQPTPDNFVQIWNAINRLGAQLADANALNASLQQTIDQQATTITSLQQQIQQAAIAAGKATAASTTTNNTGPGGGGGGGGGTPVHDSQYQVVVDVIADLLAHGEDLSGPCGSFLVVNEVVKWLRPSQPDVGIISKPSGTNCSGYSIDALMYLDGQVFDILINADNAPPTGAAPQWSFAGTRPASDWRDPV